MRRVLGTDNAKAGNINKVFHARELLLDGDPFWVDVASPAELVVNLTTTSRACQRTMTLPPYWEDRTEGTAGSRCYEDIRAATYAYGWEEHDLVRLRTSVTFTPDGGSTSTLYTHIIECGTNGSCLDEHQPADKHIGVSSSEPAAPAPCASKPPSSPDTPKARNAPCPAAYGSTTTGPSHDDHHPPSARVTRPNLVFC